MPACGPVNRPQAKFSPIDKPAGLPDTLLLFAEIAMSDTAHTSPEMPHNDTAVRVCASAALVNGGLGVKVPVTDSAGKTTAFFVRYQNQVYGYLNRCAHVGVELDWEGSFFTRVGDLIMCARHGAVYVPDTGLCVGGPCKNGRLSALSVQEREDGVYWLPTGKIQPAT